MSISAKGNNGTIEVNDYNVIIRRSGLNARLLGLRGDKEIMIKNITAIQFKKPGILTNGFIQFAFSGSSESKGGVFDATKDENSVVFTSKELRNFEAVRDFINQRRNDLHNDKPSIPQQSNDDIYTQIEKLSELKDKGIITPDEFDRKKQQLLGI